MAEDLPCFDLGFQSLNVEKEEKIGCQLDKISTEKKNARFVHPNEQDISTFGRRRGGSHKSSTTWAVKVFKGMKERRKTNYFVTNERNHCDLKQREFV